MESKKYRIIEDPIYGYRRLDPIPTDEELTEYYQHQYYERIRRGEVGDNLRALLAGGDEAEKERSWLRSTFYQDILSILEEHCQDLERCLLDLGCGTGDLITFLQGHDWEVMGLEPSADASALAQNKGLKVLNLSIGDFISQYPQYLNYFQVVTMIGVLEHLPHPVQSLNQIKELLADSGILVVFVPNDFNELQLSAQKLLNKEPWWIAVPDHINYFNFHSLSSLLGRLGFEVIYSQCDYPMELFLLKGRDYIRQPEVGKKCHQERCHFEMAIPDELRRRLYRALATAGLGRNCLIFARLGQ